MTPLQLEMLMKAYVGGQNYGYDCLADTDVHKEQFQNLVGCGLMAPGETPAHMATLTPKGKFFIEHILSLPCPVEVVTYQFPAA